MENKVYELEELVIHHSSDLPKLVEAKDWLTKLQDM